MYAYELLQIWIHEWHHCSAATGRVKQNKKNFPIIMVDSLLSCDTQKLGKWIPIGVVRHAEAKVWGTTCNSIWSFLPKTQTYAHTQLVNIPNSCMEICHIVRQVKIERNQTESTFGYFGNMRVISCERLIILQNCPPPFSFNSHIINYLQWQ